MTRIGVEICIGASTKKDVVHDVTAACQGGCTRIELCAEMKTHGLTPAVELISAAKKACHPAVKLQVMIRPRPGNFAYTLSEINVMLKQIQEAAQAGADGVVFGVARHGRLPLKQVQTLVNCAHQEGVFITFHRAFDTLTKQQEALETLIELGVQRILTSGTGWESQRPVIAGLGHIQSLLDVAAGRIELVLGGGVGVDTVPIILQSLSSTNYHFSLHAYSGVLLNGRISKAIVAQLCALAYVTDNRS